MKGQMSLNFMDMPVIGIFDFEKSRGYKLSDDHRQTAFDRHKSVVKFNFLCVSCKLKTKEVAARRVDQ